MRLVVYLEIDLCELLLSLPILFVFIYYFIRKPFVFLGTLLTIVRRNLGSANYLLGSLVTFPKSVYIGYNMQRANITHIHAHFANHPATSAFIIHRIFGIPYSFTAHGADFQVDQHMLCEKIAESAFTVTISKYNRKFLAEICGQHLQEKIKVLYCGVDTNVFMPPTSDALVAPSSTFTIIAPSLPMLVFVSFIFAT